LLGLFLFIFTIMAKELFGLAPLDPDRIGLNEWANFSSFPIALLTVFRIATNDSWRSLMESCRLFDEAAAVIFYPTVVILMNFFFLNLFISVMLENFSEMENEDEAPVRAEDFQRFQTLWSHFDPDATSYIAVSELRAFLLELPPPLGLSDLGVARQSEVNATIGSLGLRVRNNRVHMQEVLFALVDRVCGTSSEAHSQLDIRSLQQMSRRIEGAQAALARKAARSSKSRSERARDALVYTKFLLRLDHRGEHAARVERESSMDVDLSVVQAAMTVQFYWRRYMIRKRLRASGEGSVVIDMQSRRYRDRRSEAAQSARMRGMSCTGRRSTIPSSRPVIAWAETWGTRFWHRVRGADLGAGAVGGSSPGAAPTAPPRAESRARRSGAGVVGTL